MAIDRRSIAVPAFALALVSCATVVSFDGYEARPPTGPVTVRLSSSSAVTVIFHGADGAVLDVQRAPEVDGFTFTSNVPATQVTVAYEASRSLTTFGGIERGDEIVLSVDSVASDPVGRLFVALPPLPSPRSYGYSLSVWGGSVGGKDDPPDAIVLPLSTTDVDENGTVTLLAQSGRGDTALYVVARNVPVKLGEDTRFALSGPWLPPERAGLTIDVPSVAAGVTYTKSGSLVAALIGDRRVAVPTASSLAFPPGADELVIDTTIARNEVNLAWYVHQRAPVSPVHVDLRTLPSVAAGVDLTDRLRPVLTWAADQDRVLGAEITLSQTWSDASAQPQTFSWTFVEPPTLRAHRAPELPVEIASWLPAEWSPAGGTHASLELAVVDGDPSPPSAGKKTRGYPSVIPANAKIGFRRWSSFRSIH